MFLKKYAEFITEAQDEKYDRVLKGSERVNENLIGLLIKNSI